MKITVAALTLSFCYLSVAEVQLVEHQAGEENAAEIHSSEPACFCAGDLTGSQKSIWVILRDLEAKLENTVKQLEDLRGEVQGKKNKNITEL